HRKHRSTTAIYTLSLHDALPILVRSSPTGMDAAQTEAAAAFESGLVAGVAPVGIPVVGVELRSTEPSQVPWYKSKGISSVDDLEDRKSTRLNSSHLGISYAVFCL